MSSLSLSLSAASSSSSPSLLAFSFLPTFTRNPSFPFQASAHICIRPTTTIATHIVTSPLLKRNKNTFSRESPSVSSFLSHPPLSSSASFFLQNHFLTSTVDNSGTVSSVTTQNNQGASESISAAVYASALTSTSASASTVSSNTVENKLKDVNFSTDRIILYDGDCGLCSRAVEFVLNWDTKAQFKFASLQGDVGQYLLQKYDCPTDLSTMVYIEKDHAYTYSSAPLRVASRLPQMYMSLPAILSLMAVPRTLRDAAYRFVASNRYQWFGRGHCSIRNAEVKKRFLDQ